MAKRTKKSSALRATVARLSRLVEHQAVTIKKLRRELDISGSRS